jgi:pimeloyl-ACP methyl ester carboxylesterase
MQGFPGPRGCAGRDFEKEVKIDIATMVRVDVKDLTSNKIKKKEVNKMNALKIIGMVVSALILILAVFFLVPPKDSVYGIPSGFAEKQFNTGDVVLNYVEGPDNGVPLLLIPGQMESWQGYKLVMPELAKKYHVFSVDLRGHGKSSRTPGQYSYNICGNDLKLFLEKVIKEPAIVSGLSSGGVLAVWLAAYAPDVVVSVISEDPPMFSSIWPRIQQEKYMTFMFQNAVDAFGDPKGRNLEAFFAKMGVPQQGKDEMLYIPTPIVKGMMFLINITKTLKPNRPFDVPFISYEQRVGLKFFSEYDVDFSRATIDGRLSAGFDPEDALQKVKCPILLLQASWSRHTTWGLLGAMDDADVQKIKSLVKDLRYAHIDTGHAIHLGEPNWYLEQVNSFVN